MATTFWIVDTFSSVPFGGTSAAVLLTEKLDDEITLQNVAMEINAHETIFAKDLGNRNFEAKTFTRNRKGLYFGNSLYALSKIISNNNPKLRDFNIIRGIRNFVVNINDRDEISIRFSKVETKRVSPPANISAALDKEIIVSIAECKDELIVEIRSPKRLKNINPNMDVIKHLGYNSYIITTDTHYEEQTDYDYCAVVYAPNLGVFKGILTPIAQAKLASYWQDRMEKKDLIGIHCDNEKESKFKIKIDNDFTIITGNCNITTEGEMLVF